MKPTLIYYVAASLDGYIARPDGRIDWLAPLEDTGEDHGYNGFYEGIDGLLMGRGTYETVQALGGDWPYPGKPCIVLSRTPQASTAAEVTFSHSTPSEALDALATAGCRRIWLVGGGSLAATCLAASLLDELVVSLVPYLLGAGIPLFSVGLERRLKLHEQRSFATGVVQLHYHVPREEETQD